MNLKPYQKRLAEVCKWNPDEESLTPYVDMNNTKINHIAKDMLKDLGYANKAINAAKKKDTLYNVLRSVPTGNKHLMIMGKVTPEEIIDNIKGGLKDTDLTAYMLDGGIKYIEAIADAQRELNAVTFVPGEVEVGDMKLVMPDDATATAVNALLERSGLPNLEDLFTKIEEERGEVVKVKTEGTQLKKELTSREKDLEKAQSEIRSLMAKASTMSAGPVEIESDGTIPAGKMVTKKAEELFPGVKLATNFDLPFWEWEGPHPDVPVVDENYIFRPQQLQRVLYALLTNQRAYLQGHTGTGKTTLIEQVAARLNYPFIRINFDSEITRMDLIGRDTLSVDGDGNTVSTFVDGILPRVMSGAYIACFDEIDFVRPDVAYVMQAALEGNGLRITEDGDRLVKPDPMFRMFATGNTVGQGDEFGMYQGARPQSLALLDRFTIWAKVEYLTTKEREELIKRHFPGMADKDVKLLNQYTTEHLVAFEGGKVIQPISPRGILATARAFTILGDMKEALSLTVLDRANQDDYATLKGLVDRVVSA